jgi:hypothetical protein
MFNIYSGSTGPVLTVKLRALDDASRDAWQTEEEAVAEYRKQKKRNPQFPLVVIEYVYRGTNRIVIDDRAGCCFCGGNDGVLHRYGTTHPDFSRDLEERKAVYACNFCDPILAEAK